MTLSPEVQAILDRVKAGEPELTAAEKRDRRKAERPAPASRPRRVAAVGPHGSRQPQIASSTQRAIVEDYQNGATISGLAREHGHDVTTVRNCLKWHAVWVPGKQKGTPVQRDDLNPILLLALHEQGMSAWAISKQLGAATGTVTSRLRALGVEIASAPGGGRPVQAVCARGHQKEPGACRECKRIRQRNWRRDKTARLKVAATAAA